MSIATNHGNHRKGTTVINTEHTSKAPHSTGIFAALRAFLHLKGSGAPSSTPVLTTLATIATTLLASAGLTAALPASASAYATIEPPPVFSSAPGLPDGRIYEQVSTTNTHGNEAGASTQPEIAGASQRYGYATADGNSVLFEATGPLGESPSVDSLEFVATKKHDEAGWSTRALEPAQHLDGAPVETLSATPRLLDPSPDLSHAMVVTQQGTLASSLPDEKCDSQMYLTGSDPFEAATWLEHPEIADPITNCAVQTYGAGAPVGGTPDFSTVYFTYPGTLLPEDAERAPHAGSGESGVEAWGFYEDHEGTLREAGVLPDGKLDEFGAVPAASVHGNALAGNQVSSDGSRAFFVSPDPSSCEQEGGQNDCAVDPPELYVRENGERTQLVSRDTLLPETGGRPAPAPGGVLQMPNPNVDGVSGNDGSYVFASPDGSQAFFQSTDDLTEAARQASPGTEPKTYDFDLDTGVLTFLPNVLGPLGRIVATDTEGTSLAFMKPETGGAPAELDLWSAGPGGGSVTPIAQLSQIGKAPGTVSQARMSTDGSVVVFGTVSTLSAAFNSGGNEQDDEQIYRYDVPANTLGCVSCAPAGVTPNGSGTIYPGQVDDAHGMVDSRAISADGDRVFFATATPLVPQDTNTDAPEVICSGAISLCRQGEDVYEWENGVVYLISGGKSPRNSDYLGSSENGDDVFFATTEALTPGHTDGGYAVYDARVPHPGDNPPPAAVPCEGSVCQGPPNVPSPLTPPASATFSGLGNPAPEVAATTTVTKKTMTKTVKCKKGLVKNSKGKCVKKVRHERKKNRRSKK